MPDTPHLRGKSAGLRPRLGWRPKVATAVVLLIPTVLSHALAAYAMSMDARPKSVRIGTPYQLRSETIMRGHCPGCTETSVPAMSDAILHFKLVTSGKEQAIELAGDAQFVSPVTGVLHFVSAQPSSAHTAHYQEKCPGITFSGADSTFDIEEIYHEQ